MPIPMSSDAAHRPILRELPDRLVGPRVIVRPYQPDDGAAVWEAIDESRTHLHPWLPWPAKHQTPEDTEAFVRRWQANWLLREDLAVGLWARDDGRYLGGSGLHRINWDVPSFEVGYWLRLGAEGFGYMTEAVTLLCGLAFDTLGAQRVFIRCATDNTRSAAIPRRLGFTREGILRNDSRDVDGRLYDMAVFALTPQEWIQQAGAGESTGGEGR
jgi:ribosomal-protein-serine acetyltransferase